jgi:hypothetical protein
VEVVAVLQLWSLDVSSHVLSSIGYEATTVDENKINLKRMII